MSIYKFVSILDRIFFIILSICTFGVAYLIKVIISIAIIDALKGIEDDKQ
jgi:hypothetical protein